MQPSEFWALTFGDFTRYLEDLESYVSAFEGG